MASRAIYGVKLLFLSTSLLSHHPTGNPIANAGPHLDNAPTLEQRQTSFFSVLGVTGLDNSLHPRLDIRELEKDADQWNIFILGLRRFQNTDQNDKLSYYQIAGIHGRPYIAWDGVDQSPGGFGGYCTHGSNLFPTWHRPYLALYEEILWANAREEIRMFPEGELRDRYNKALTTFRMPYWDWAAKPPPGEGVMPGSVQRPTISVVFPNGTITIDNPLFAYRFHPLPSAEIVDTPYSSWPTTLRDPNTKDGDAVSRNDLVASTLDSSQTNFQSRVYNVLAMQHNYTQISNDLNPGESLESVHDTIHAILGRDGHMSVLAYSAFDPVFWLLHTNVDRILALWQTINPNEYVTPQSNPYSTFTTQSGSTADKDTPLGPFHRNDAGDFWTSEGIRSTTTFGYTYPELVDLGIDASALTNRINELYGPDAAAPAKRSLAIRSTGSSPLRKRRSFQKADIAGAPSFTGRRTYTTNIKVPKFGLDGSFTVYIFLGPEEGDANGATTNARDWIHEEAFVGVVGVLAQPNPGPDKLGVEANGVVPLTAALEARVRSGDLASLEEGVVGGYLKGGLRWRVARVNGDEIPIENIPQLQVSVLWTEVEPATSEHEFPRMRGEYRVLVDATDGRPGGFGKGDRLY